MASTTPTTSQPTTRTRRTSSHSRTRIPSRPTTPLRPPSRTSLRASQNTPSGSGGGSGSAISANPDILLNSLEPAFAELSDSMADLEANFMHLQLLNDSISRFNENFGAFLYGMNMSAFCVDFPEAPIPQSFSRSFSHSSPSNNPTSPYPTHQHHARTPAPDTDATFLTNDTSFVENPPTSSKPASKYSAPPSAAGSKQSGIPGRGGAAAAARGRGAGGSGIARGAGRGVSRVARGVGRGRARGVAGAGR